MTDKRGWEKRLQIEKTGSGTGGGGASLLPPCRWPLPLSPSAAAFGSNCWRFLRDRLIEPGEHFHLMEWLIGVPLTGAEGLLGERAMSRVSRRQSSVTSQVVMVTEDSSYRRGDVFEEAAEKSPPAN